MKTQRMPSRSRHLLLGMVVLGAAAMYSYHAQAATGQPAIPPGVALKSWQDNGADGHYLLQVIEGQTPKTGKTIVGTVTSDTDCQADAEGLSHCHNAIKLADGGSITVVDTHEMHRNRCMQPGEQISLKVVGKAWVIGTVFKK